VDHFLAELGRRLDFLETYGHVRLDAGIERAWSTLHAVRNACSHVSDELTSAGFRRAAVLVETLEDRYKGALATKETLEQKVAEGVRFLENHLTSLEAQAYAQRDSSIAKAGELLDETWRAAETSFEKAKEAVVDPTLDLAHRATEALRHKIATAVVIAREHGLITYEDLPDPWRVNPHIVRGYRFSETWRECLHSTLRLSNETINIWSHFLGLVFMISLAFYIYPHTPTYASSTPYDILIAGIFFFAACKCLLCSTLWHTMSSISSQPVMERFACVDYTGISLLVATSIMTTEYTAFYCEPVSRWSYLILTAALGLCGTILPWHPTFNRADMAWARVAFYVGLGATGFLPALQLAITRGPVWAALFYAPIGKSVAVYLIGAVLYAMKVPERWCPGMFDYVGGSHNIWHLAVLGGIFFHWMAMQEFFRLAFERKGRECGGANGGVVLGFMLDGHKMS